MKRRFLSSPVAVVSAVWPYPTDAGKKVVLAGLLDYLADRVGADSLHYVYVSRSGLSPSSAGQHLEMPARVHCIEAPGTREQAFSALRRTLLTGRHSLQESMLYAPRVRAELRQVLHQIGARLEIFDTVRMGQFALEIPASDVTRRVLYMDDLFSVRYSRMLVTMRQHPDAKIAPLGEFRHVVPSVVSPIVDQRFVQRSLLEVERRLVGRRERESVPHFESCLLVSPEESARLNAEIGASSVQTLPPVVDPHVPPRRYQEPATFVLLGLLSLPHNHDAAVTFLRGCMPELSRRLPTSRVLIVGREASPEILREAEIYEDRVEVLGYVPDLGSVLSAACAVLAPLRFGSGVKIKVLEAIAHGVPVLATPVGAEGILAGEDRGILVEHDLSLFPTILAKLAEPDYNRRLSNNALAHHAATYSRAAAFRQYDDIFAR